MSNFKLNSILEQDSLFIDKLKLCQLRLMNNSDFPWVVLIPEINNIAEITDLNSDEFDNLNSEILQIAKIMQSVFAPDKLNIASIGNIVPQLHFHIIARFKNDKLFPKPVWGNPYNYYNANAAEQIINKLQLALKLSSF